MLEFKPFDIDSKLTATAPRKTAKNRRMHILARWNLCGILSIKTRDSDRLVAEGLVRSALNFAANRSAYMARADIGKVEKDPFITLGFEEKTAFTSPISRPH